MRSLNLEYINSLSEENAEKYQLTKPFPYITFENFLNEEVANKIIEDFPIIDGSFYKYDNPLEKKYAFDRVSELPDSIKNTLIELNSPPFLNFLERLTGIEGLIPDPYYRGGGIHQSKRGGKLDIHVDFNRHPKLKLVRRLNVLIYLNKDWKEEYSGDFQIWDGYRNKDSKHVLTELIEKIYPTFNKFACFNTSERSYHGFPEEIQCPEGVTRKSIALYYYTVKEEGECEFSNMHSTTFVKLPHENNSLDKMREERNKGRLSSNIKDADLS